MSKQSGVQKIAWFNRAKPLNKDALEIFKQTSRVFIGYPLIKEDVNFDPHALRSCLVDPTCPDDEWECYKQSGQIGNMHSRNRNFIPSVKEGSIVVIPRPEEGAVYIGRIKRPFKIVDSPDWGGDYRSLRESQGCKWRCDDIAQVAQGWSVAGYKRFDLSLVPGWMRHSMFGRSTFGRFKDCHPLDANTTAWGVLDQILKGEYQVSTSWNCDLKEIKRRLVDTMTANAFENLIVSLLQLDHPDEIWHQTGGPGDGGIDGLGSDENGNVVGLMQAKLYDDGTQPLNLGNLGHKASLRRYAAILVQKKRNPPNDGTKFLDLERIARAVLRHWQALPQARAMRIGEE
ncbi:MAG: hypothetical protein F4Z86_18680 [Gemmatimonadetes bacterium]|nr:hypothetical protein [Gemmatimonadota bacterium]MYB57221.1 hypothetical protein [Gemmatimonadota bacterium]